MDLRPPFDHHTRVLQLQWRSPQGVISHIHTCDFGPPNGLRDLPIFPFAKIWPARGGRHRALYESSKSALRGQKYPQNQISSPYPGDDVEPNGGSQLLGFLEIWPSKIWKIAFLQGVFTFKRPDLAKYDELRFFIPRVLGLLGP